MFQTITALPLFKWLITLSFLAIVVILSVTPSKNQGANSVFVWLVVNTPTPLQKLMHVACYAVLAGLCFWTLGVIESRVPRLLLVFVLLVGLGGILEWFQSRAAGRFGTVRDVLLNILGTIIGVTAAAFL